MKSIILSAGKIVGGLALAAFVMIAIIKLLPQPFIQIQPGISNPAYPPPGATPSPTWTNTPIPYPPPVKSGTQTQTPAFTFAPPTKSTPPRPTDWPTDLPWPPGKITPKPLPTKHPTVFPTPAFGPKPAGNTPASLKKLWYVYSPNSVSTPIIQVEQMDSAIQRWGKTQTLVDLGLSLDFPGPFLYDLIPSPDSKWIAAELGFGDTSILYIISADTGKALQILPKNPFAAFITWKPDSQRIIVNDNNADSRSVAEVDIATGAYHHIDFPKLDGDLPNVNTIAYSHDGSLMADALAYQRRKGGRSDCLLSIGITDVKSQERKTIQEISTACGAIDMQWSADGHYLSWIAQKSVYDTKLAGWAEQDELWVSNRVSGESKSIYLIGVNVSRLTSPAWSPDGKKIAFVKYNETKVRYPDGNIILIDPIKGPENQVSHFSVFSLASVQWSSDGKWLFCNAFNAQYGTIWAINLESNTSFPVAGPVAPASPFVLTP